MDLPALYPCPVKGCPWRGPNPDACPMHEDEGHSSIRKLMMPADISHRQNTRHRR